MSELYQLHAEPALDAPVLVVALRGWVDAGAAASAAAEVIIDQGATTPVATFDPDAFLDYRARRPTLTVNDGITGDLAWPAIELVSGRDQLDRDVLLLHGHEPDARWFGFIAAVRDLATRFGVTRMVTLGAYPAAVPHTRPTRVTITATAEALVEPQQVMPGRIELPAGVSAAIERDLASVGIPAVGLWAQVPHYGGTTPFPAATRSLLLALAVHGPLHFSADTLHDAIEAATAQLDDLTGANDDNRQLLAELERLHDQVGLTDDLPSGDELADEVQQFLRDIDNDS